MTTRVTIHQTCDRCESPFVEKLLKAGDKVPTLKSKGIVVYQTSTADGETEQSTKPLLTFNDLCEKCAGVVEKALANLAPPGTVKAKPKTGKKRGRPSKAEIAAREAAKSAAEAEVLKAEDPTVEPYTEPESEPSEEPAVDLGLAGDAVVIEDESLATATAEIGTAETEDDPFADRETFEDPDTGDIRDVHTGEILEKRVDGAASGAHPF